MLLDKRKKLAMEIDPLSNYIPNGRIEQFIKGIQEGHDKGIRVFLLLAANGVGKTAALVNLLGNIIWGAPNKYFKHKIFEKWPYPKTIRFVTESELAKDTGPFDVQMRKWWKGRKWETFKRGKQYNSEYRANDWLIDKMTYQQEGGEFEGVTRGMVVYDEPPPQDIFNRGISRLREGGITLIWMTPLKNAAWICDKLENNSNWFMLHADVEDACVEHGVRGHLMHDNIEKMVAEYDDEEKEARMSGKFMHLSSRIWRDFDRQYHVVPENTYPKGDVQYGMVVDPHGGKPFAIAYYWVDRRGQIVFYDEYPKTDFTKIKNCSLGTKDYIKIIRQMDKSKKMTWRIIDRHFANSRDIQTELTLKEWFEEAGMDFEDSYNIEREIETGILKVKGYLRFDKKSPIDGSNFPRLLVKANCHNTIRSLERWAYNQDTGKPDVNSKYKDFADLVRYACNHNLEFINDWQVPPFKARYTVGR